MLESVLDQRWRSAPWPALHIGCGARPGIEPNAAAAEWARRFAVPAAAWPQVVAAATALDREAEFDVALPGLAQPARFAKSDVGGACTLRLVAWTEPRSDPAPPLLSLVCIEDHPVNMMLVRELLALRPRIELHCAVDGEAGVALARRVRPQVMLIDLELPGINGIEVMRRVRQTLGSSCCYVALTADAVPEHVEAALAAGIDRYWTKPIVMKRFLADIDALTAARAAG